MKKIISIIFTLSIINMPCFADTISGSLAEQLYNLIPGKPIKKIFDSSLNMKFLDQTTACSQVMPGPNKKDVLYHCMVTTTADGSVVFSEEASGKLFDALRDKAEQETTRMQEYQVIYKRILGDITCKQILPVQGTPTHSCIMKQ